MHAELHQPEPEEAPSAASDEAEMRRALIEQSIDEALATDQIEVWYQPQIDYVFGEIVGAEALARWNHPELGWISPAEFVSVLERCGKIHDLDLFVWEEACRNAGRWRLVADGKPVPISVNVSHAEIFEPGLMEHFKELQRRYGLPDGSLRLEVAESAFAEGAERLYHIINSMRENDMIVEMDDFGSGLSSLVMLKNAPVDVVKLDMSFMRDSADKKRSGVVLGSVIRMLQGLDTPIIAEGVETLEQAEMLKNMGCHLMQGYHFSRPMPLEEFESFVASNATADNASRRRRTESRLDDILSFDWGTSFFFNEAVGGMMLFFVHDGESESILVNDRFYEECGLNRSDYRASKVNPFEEIGEGERGLLMGAAVKAREKGSAMYTVQVRTTGRWVEAVVRYIGPSARGDIFALNICRSGDSMEAGWEVRQLAQEVDWSLDALDKIVPNGLVKCEVNGDMKIDYISRRLVEASGLAPDEFSRRFHNSLLKAVVIPDRAKLADAVRDSVVSGDLIDVEVRLYHGFGNLMRVGLLGRVSADSAGKHWLYLLVMPKDVIEGGAFGDREGALLNRAIPFDYFMASDFLVIHAPLQDGMVRDIEIEHWTDKLELMPDSVSPLSAAKVLATVSDLRHHPLSGFIDLKCNLRGGDELRWYHINYTCESDENGNTTVLHGYAHDANDEIGSAKWWRRQAEIDQLTGLLNRNTAEQAINLSVRTSGGGMMAMVDLDGFKRVNDEMGHLVGDDLLRGVANALSGCFSDGDVLGRYGGDEFVGFVPFSGTPEEAYQHADELGHEILRAVEGVAIPDGTNACCSVGIAIALTRDSSFYDLLEVADHAMYASKLAGKGTLTITSL